MYDKVVIVFTYFVLFVYAAKLDVKRNVTETLYPDCQQYAACMKMRDNQASDNFQNLIYVRSVACANNSDVLHFVMSTIHVPSVLVVHTVDDKHAHLSFNWDHLLSASKLHNDSGISVSGGHTNYSFVTVFSKLIEYDDVNDDASLADAEQDNSTRWNIKNFADFKWKNVSIKNDGKSFIFAMCMNSSQCTNNTDNLLSFEFAINNDTGRDEDLPKMLLNSNNTLFTFEMNKYPPSFKQSRFALELSIVGNRTSQASHTCVETSLDDEFSSGVFQLVNWFAGKEGHSGYLQWKPVCYLDELRGRATSTYVNVGDLTNPANITGLEEIFGKSLAGLFYGLLLNRNASIQMMSANISFGQPHDGFYVKHNYSLWTGTTGYGTPPSEKVSTRVLAILAVGLGIPLILIVISILYVCCRKKKRSSYEPVAGVVKQEPYRA